MFTQWDMMCLTQLKDTEPESMVLPRRMQWATEQQPLLKPTASAPVILVQWKPREQSRMLFQDKPLLL